MVNRTLLPVGVVLLICLKGFWHSEREHLTLWMLGNFSWFCCRLITFLKTSLKKKKDFRNTIIISNGLTPDHGSCNGYQQTTIIGAARFRADCCFHGLWFSMFSLCFCNHLDVEERDCCLRDVLWLLTCSVALSVGLQCLNVVLPDHCHLLFCV